jgi:hypothetical protein
MAVAMKASTRVVAEVYGFANDCNICIQGAVVRSLPVTASNLVV